MTHYVGLDVSMKHSAVCVLDAKGEIVKEGKVLTCAQSIHDFLEELEVDTIALETGSMSRALCKELMALQYSVRCIDAREANSYLKLKKQKNDRNDARGLAEILRVNLLDGVHLKSDDSVEIKTVLQSRRLLIEQRTTTKNSIRGILKHHGVTLKEMATSPKYFAETVRQVIQKISTSSKESLEALLKTVEHFDKTIVSIDTTIKGLEKKHNEVISIFKTAPGVGPIVALAFMSEIDDHARFSSGRSVGAYLGLIPTLYESGETSVKGHISKQGPSYLRSLLHESGLVILTRTTSWSRLKSWGIRLQKKKGVKKAATAVGRKLAVILWRMWKDKKPFEYSQKPEEKKKLEAAAA